MWRVCARVRVCVCVWICVRVCVFCKRNATVVGEAAGILIGGGGVSAEWP